MSKYALFLGCTTPIRVPQYELSTRWLCEHFGVELIDVQDFVCCGANQINISMESGLLLSAMNLALAEAENLDIVTLCPWCFTALAAGVEELKKEEVKAEVNRELSTIGLRYSGRTRVKHISRVLYEDIGLERIKQEVRRDLSKIRVAPHYGCRYLRPRWASKGFDEPNDPKTLHQLVSATGAVPVDYETIHLCCGGKVFPVSENLAHSLIRKKLDNLDSKEVDCMVVLCQTCYLMYATQQGKVSEKSNGQYKLPIILYPQLLGLAIGADPVSDLGLNLNVPAVDAVIAKVGNGL
jgi:heterodisulfide reductase subunit B2